MLKTLNLIRLNIIQTEFNKDCVMDLDKLNLDKLGYGGSVLVLSQFLQLPQVPQEMMLASKVVKSDSKIIVLRHTRDTLCWSTFVCYANELLEPIFWETRTTILGYDLLVSSRIIMNVCARSWIVTREELGMRYVTSGTSN